MDLIKFGQRIKLLRDKHALTQSQLAHSLRISPQAVSKWERGENAPDIVMLLPLSNFFDVSVEWILTGEDESKDTFEATVLTTSLRDFAQVSEKLSPKNTAIWMNSIFFGITETIQKYGGITVHYAGDCYLGYFSGPRHSNRALESAIDACRVIHNERLLVTLHTGEVFLGEIGHPEYSKSDILGDTVNTVFLMNRWATQESKCNLIVSSDTWRTLDTQLEFKEEHVEIPRLKKSMTLHGLSI